MKIYLAHSSQFNFKDQLYAPLRKSTLYSTHQFFFPHETNTFQNTKKVIQSSDLFVAEVSYPSTGEGIELGWASDASVPIICIYKEGTKISQSLQSVCKTFITYTDENDLITQLGSSLASWR